MLRVLFHGPSQGPTSVLHLLRVSAWEAPSQSAMRHVSHFMLRSPETTWAEKASNEDHQDKKEEHPRRVTHHKPCRNFLRQEMLRKPIRPLRPLQLPLKHFRTSELSGASAVKVNAHVHPLYRPQKEGLNDPVLRSSEEVLPESAPPQVVRCSVRLSHKGSRSALLRVLETTLSVSEAWKAYELLLKFPRPSGTQKSQSPPMYQPRPLVIRYEHLHRLARLLSTTHPRTRTVFLRLLSVLTTLREMGGTIFVWEWNALIDCAGKGWRKTTMEDYRAAVSIFKDMVMSGQRAGTGRCLPDEKPVAVQPDIITFTTLLNIASRSQSEKAISHATSLLEASKLPWNDVTDKVRLPYLIRHRKLRSVLDILRDSVHRGLDLNTLNGCLWAYARCGQLQVVLEVYELLRRNVPVQNRTHFEEVSRPSEGTENPMLNILEPALADTNLCPDKITFTILIQAMCYHGDFIAAMRIFRDMISSVDPASRGSIDPHPVGRSAVPRRYQPTLTVYRAIFLGFARHAHRKRKFTSKLISPPRNADIVPLSEFAAHVKPSDPGAESYRQSWLPQTHWTLDNLETFFKSFLELGWDDCGREQPSERMIYWIMVAYSKTTGHDVGKMQEIWRELDEHFGYGVEGRGALSARIDRFMKH